MSLFLKDYKTQLYGVSFTFKTCPRWLMRLLMLTGMYCKTRIDDDWVIYRKPAPPEKGE